MIIFFKETIDIKNKAKEIFKGLFSKVKIPNKDTQKAIEESINGINMETTMIEDIIAEYKNIKNT